MASELLALVIDAHDPVRLARFWADLLDREAVEQGSSVLLPGSPTQVGLRFARSTSVKAGPERVHLHVTSSPEFDQHRTVAKALDLGARPVDVGQLPQEQHVVLADPEDNAFCVIEVGNAYLAGCGVLGELACDGTRQVGLFWAAVLDWPLVWDQDEETAIQSAAGGTKVAWGGPPVAPKRSRNRQRLELTTADDQAREVGRLMGLGARLITTDADCAELADPDGNEFVLRRSHR